MRGVRVATLQGAPGTQLWCSADFEVRLLHTHTHTHTHTDTHGTHTCAHMQLRYYLPCHSMLAEYATREQGGLAIGERAEAGCRVGAGQIGQSMVLLRCFVCGQYGTCIITMYHILIFYVRSQQGSAQPAGDQADREDWAGQTDQPAVKLRMLKTTKLCNLHLALLP